MAAAGGISHAGGVSSDLACGLGGAGGEKAAECPPHSRVFWTTAVVCAASRFLAMARSMWDWDEALFSLGMRSYDVTLHHPHPPGFPVYIAMGKLMRLVFASDFRALQAVNLIAGVLAFPAMFLLARELQLRFETSIIASALFSFFPNVWFFGGTAFSDVPSIVLVIFAVVFLLRGRVSLRDYLLGTFLLALAIGMRPQNLLIGLFPGILATMRRPVRDVIAALAIGLFVVGLAYGGAIYATGNMHDYIGTVRAHGDYIARIDSFRSPDRPPLWRLFDRFFLKQYEHPALSVITSIFVAISVVGATRKRDRAMLYNVVIFGPFAISAWIFFAPTEPVRSTQRTPSCAQRSREKRGESSHTHPRPTPRPGTGRPGPRRRGSCAEPRVPRLRCARPGTAAPMAARRA